MTTLPTVARAYRTAAIPDLTAFVPVKTPKPFMPFRSENRMTTLLIAAVLVLCGMALLGVRFILIYGGNASSTPAWLFLGTSVAIALKLLLSMLQIEFARRDLKAEAQKTRHDLKGELHVQALKVEEMAQRANGGHLAAVREASEQVRAAERDQVIADPKCREAIADIVRETIAQMRGQQ
jgi:membrane protein implicated in regulation of membrane protease activity